MSLELGKTTNASVWMFSGQGAQKPGMGLDLQDIPEVRDTFVCASDVLGFDVAEFIETATEDKINNTAFAQPCMCVLSVAQARALLARGIAPDAVLGFSLGQISALPISGMLSDEATFAFVKERARLMAEAAAENPGCMSALLKADEPSVLALCEQCADGDVLVAANYNSPGQIVISGTSEAVGRAEAAWAEQGKRSSRLATSGAFHSPLMAQAAEKLSAYLNNLEFNEAQIPLISNVTALPLAPDQAKAQLADHLTHPVRFDLSVQNLIDANAVEFVELGYGGVLANLVKRINKDVDRKVISDRPSFDAYVNSKSECE
ncbi:ACP S-malonyltransferase [Eggerthellaceae bacterium 3-80]|nr:ACP S-malonyltransferase [bacterium D16-34]